MQAHLRPSDGPGRFSNATTPHECRSSGKRGPRLQPGCGRAPGVHHGRAQRVQRWKIPTHVIYSQNARGLKTDSALTEAIDALRHRSGFSAGLQETWRTGLEEIEEDGFVFLGAAPAVQNGRGSKGVGILLSPLAVAAWRAAGAVVHNDVGPRVIAVRMEVEDSAGRKQGLFQVASYAPISTAPDTEKDEYETALACVLSRRQSGDIVIVCADTNASIGRGCLGGQNVNYGAVGSHGIDFLNDSGRRLRSFMELHDLAALSSFFKKPFYGTWLHPCSKLQKQLDHIMISRCDLKRFTDAGACCGQLIDSDHSAVFCKLRFTVRLRRKLEPRAQLARLDTAPLLNQDQAVQFATDVVTSLGTSDASAVSYSTLAKAVEKTAAETLPKRERPAPLWFAAKEGVLRAVIANRNATFNAHQRQPTADAAARYREARSRVQLEIRRAKSDWILGKCTAINDGICGATGSAAAWATVKVLKAGLAPPRRAPPARLKKADGSLADTPEENASVFADAFSQLYGREASFDPSVLDDLPQRPVAVGLDHVPSDDEIQLATSKLHATAPGPSGLHARLWQALVSTSDGFGFVRHLVQHFWETEELPEGWETGLLSILPKKGDLSLPGNYRGIMMLETAYKIAGNIILVRLKPIKEGGTLNHENQNGFRPNRGCFDAIFSIKTLIKKRREHGLETWLLLIDLVKAFDRVPRELLWRVMLKQGVPPKIVSLLKALHATVKVQFEVGGVKKVIDSIIGVKQGDLLGPELFIFFMAAVMETWRLHHDFELCVVRSKSDFVLTGRRRLPSAVLSSPSETRCTPTTRASPSALGAASRSRRPRWSRTSLAGAWRSTSARTAPTASLARTRSRRCSSARRRRPRTTTPPPTTAPTCPTSSCPAAASCRSWTASNILGATSTATAATGSTSTAGSSRQAELLALFGSAFSARGTSRLPPSARSTPRSSSPSCSTGASAGRSPSASSTVSASSTHSACVRCVVSLASTCGSTTSRLANSAPG